MLILDERLVTLQSRKTNQFDGALTDGWVLAAAESSFSRPIAYSLLIPQDVPGRRMQVSVCSRLTHRPFRSKLVQSVSVD